MNTNMIAKWFYDNNMFVKEQRDDRIKYLTFTASCCIGIDEEIQINDRSILLNPSLEEYKFGTEVENLLNCINRDLGYVDNYKDSYMFDRILINEGDSLKKKYYELEKYYREYKKDILREYEDYNFNKKVVEVGANIYFINFDEELTKDELKQLKIDDQKQKIYEVYKSNGELMIL